MAMACGSCGSRLITKTRNGLECCGCGRPFDSHRQGSGGSLSLQQQLLAMGFGLALLPLVGAMALTGELRARSSLVPTSTATLTLQGGVIVAERSQPSAVGPQLPTP